MINNTTRFIKTVLFMTSFGFITTNAFCSGTITGTIDTNMPKYKGDAVVYLVGINAPVVPQHKIIEQQSLTFVPKVTTIPVGSTVEFKNNDKLYSHIISISPAKKFNVDKLDQGSSRKLTFNKPGAVQLLNKAHSEMSAWVIITKNQYAAVSEHDGKFTIRNVPAGTYEIRAWSEKLKPQGNTKVTVADGKTAPVVLKMAI
ncbi:MAG: carboxypeptidase regulatory-like domain-containing protein [Chlorobiaceae bacterium]